MKKLALYKCFNPRTHTGCDLLGKVLTTRLYSFQSAHPHGVRLRYDLTPQNVCSFNPRTHTGCDAFRTSSKGKSCMVSIHAPTRGATMTIFTKTINRYVSIHAPTRGATTSTLLKMVKYMFQSTHPHGVRHNLGSFLEKIKSFNPRTHTGCDLFS